MKTAFGGVTKRLTGKIFRKTLELENCSRASSTSNSVCSQHL